MLESEVDRNYVTITVRFDYSHRDKEHVPLEMLHNTNANIRTYALAAHKHRHIAHICVNTLLWMAHILHP